MPSNGTTVTELEPRTIEQEIDGWWKGARPSSVILLRTTWLPQVRLSLVGMDEADVDQFLYREYNNLLYTRLRTVDGRTQSMTADVKPWRVDIDVRNGVIVGAL